MTSSFWLPRAAIGLGVGTALALVDFAYYLPVLVAAQGEPVASLLSLILSYGPEGALVGSIVAFAEWHARPDHLSLPKLALAVAVGALGSAAIWRGSVFAELIARSESTFFMEISGRPMETGNAILYHAWLMLFFGELVAAIYFFSGRRARLQAELRSTQLGYEESQRRSLQLRLDRLRAQVDPEQVTRWLDELERLYDADPEKADDSLRELVGHLRNGLAQRRTAPSNT
jgi:hypothetical protein